MTPRQLEAARPAASFVAPPPPLHAVAASLYEALRPMTYADAANGWALAAYCQAIGALFQQVDTLARDDPPHAGWTIIVDPDRAPVEGLPWLAQLVGAKDDASLSEADRRERIKRLDGTKRGTPDALRAAAQAHLTGDKAVILAERYGADPYALRVITWTAETPDPAAVQAALVTQKPAGIVLTYLTAAQWDYEVLAADRATYAAVVAGAATYAALLTGGP